MARVNKHIDYNAPSNCHPDDMTQHIKLKGKNCVQYILAANYNFIVSLHNKKTSEGLPKLRDYCFDQIQKCILCGSLDLGYTLYECPECGNYTIIPNTCKSRLCPKCGVKQAKMRAAYISNLAVDAPHRHGVFTIAEELRTYYLKDRSRLNGLFIAFRNTIYICLNMKLFKKWRKKHSKYPSDYFFQNEKNNLIIPGMIATLHTFGRDLHKYNPHIHALLCMKAYNQKNNKMRKVFFKYDVLRRTWKYQVLEQLSRDPKLKNDPEFKTLKRKLYQNENCYDEDTGFYVHMPESDAEIYEKECIDKGREIDNDKLTENVKGVASYIIRYTSRPAIADSRIDEFNEKKNTVTYHYNRHEDDVYVSKTEDAHQFIVDLVMHCPDKNFKMVRYYGFYSNAYAKKLDNIYKCLTKKGKKTRRRKQRRHDTKEEQKKYKFRYSMITSYNRDPVKCKCGAIMLPTYREDPYEKKGGAFSELIFRHKRDAAIQANLKLVRETRRRMRLFRPLVRRMDR